MQDILVLTAAIFEVRNRGDSCGGEVTCVVRNAPTGLGSPVFDKLEAELAKAVMSLPASKVIFQRLLKSYVWNKFPTAWVPVGLIFYLPHLAELKVRICKGFATQVWARNVCFGDNHLDFNITYSEEHSRYCQRFFFPVWVELMGLCSGFWDWQWLCWITNAGQWAQWLLLHGQWPGSDQNKQVN